MSRLGGNGGSGRLGGYGQVGKWRDDRKNMAKERVFGLQNMVIKKLSTSVEKYVDKSIKTFLVLGYILI